MTDQPTAPADNLAEPDNPAAWALARHIADHPMSTVQAAFRYLNAPLSFEVHDDGLPEPPATYATQPAPCPVAGVDNPATSADTADNPPDQLAALRAWLVDAAARARHDALHARLPEVQEAKHGVACGHETAVRLIDRLLAGERLPVIQGVHPSECTDDHTQALYPHQDGDVTVIGPECFTDGTVISYRGENYVRQAERADELARLRAQVAEQEEALARVRVLLPLNRDLDRSELRMIPATELRAALDGAHAPEAGR